MPAKKTTKKAAKKVATKAAAPAKKAAAVPVSPTKVATKAVKTTATTTAKKAAKKTAVKAVPSKLTTSVIARVDVGFGNHLTIRGEGAGLSWEEGTPMACVDGSQWTWSTTGATSGIVFKLLLNDEVWMQGDDMTAAAGATVVAEPDFG